MNWLLLCRMVGLLAMLAGASMVFSLPWAFPACGQTQEFESAGFWGLVASIACSLAVGSGLFLIGRRSTGPVLRKEALAIVGLGWLLCGLLGGLPFVLSGTLKSAGAPMSVVDALFESISGFTTTGASVLTQLEAPGPGDPNVTKLVPRCVLFWRSFTHWLGGMGIVVLFVALLGQLGAAGKVLMRREVPGPIAESVRPRVRETAIVMWGIYVGMSLLLTVLLLWEGMSLPGGISLYDALCHTFGTMATGGFSTYNASIGQFSSPLVELTLVVFMLGAGTNFSLYYVALRRSGSSGGQGLTAGLGTFVRDPEFRTYAAVVVCATALLTASLLSSGVYARLADALRHAGFTAVSIMTTTGFGTEDFNRWSEFSRGLLLLLMFVGGCSGSTAGGIKVIRFLLFAKIVRLEVEQAFRPNVVRPLTLFGHRVDGELRHAVVVYFSLVLFIFVSSWMLLAAIEPDAPWRVAGESPSAETSDKLIDCASAVAATLNNIGPGLGVLGPHSNYSGFSPAGKLLLTLLMLLGRLELFAVLVLFVPSFWRAR